MLKADCSAHGEIDEKLGFYHAEDHEGLPMIPGGIAGRWGIFPQTRTRHHLFSAEGCEGGAGPADSWRLA